MKRIFIFLITIGLCGSISAQFQSQMQDKAEKWLKSSVQSNENASLRGDGEDTQGGNRAGDEEAKGIMKIPVGDGVYLMLLLAGAYACFYLLGQKQEELLISG